MLEAATFTERTGRTPLFLLDDPFAELDVRRSSRMLDMLTTGENRGDRQTFSRCRASSDIPREFTGTRARSSMTAGQIAPYA